MFPILCVWKIGHLANIATLATNLSPQGLVDVVYFLAGIFVYQLL